MLTLTAACRAKMSQLPESGPSGCVGGTVKDVFAIAAAANITMIVALQGSRGSAGLAESGGEGRRAECS